MKRCPECRRDYYDETLLYCLDDGNALLEGPATAGGENPTAIFIESDNLKPDVVTQAQIHTTNLTETLPAGMAGEVSKTKNKIWLAGAIGLAAVAAVAAWFYYPRSTKPVPKGEMTMTRVVTGIKGRPSNQSISPDGKYIAYTVRSEDKTGLYLRQISQDVAIQVVAPLAYAFFRGTTFSNDGELIYYVSGNSQTDPRASLYSVPVLGEREPKKILDFVSRPVSFAPDGKRFTFVRIDPNGESAIIIATTDSNVPEQRIATRKGDYWFIDSIWSPDGNHIVATTGKVAGGTSFSLVEVPVTGGDERPIGKELKQPPDPPVWLPDGSGLILSVAERAGQPFQLYRLSYPDGEMSRITHDPNDYLGAGITRDGTTLVTLLGDYPSQIWTVPAGGSEQSAKQISTGKHDGDAGLSVLADGRIVYVAYANDDGNIWIMNSDGTGKRAVTTGPESGIGSSTGAAATSPDGRTIVFCSFRPDNVPHLWRINSDGSGLRQLTTAEDYNPSISPDGKSFVFNSFRVGGASTLWKLTIDGGEPIQLMPATANTPVISPDGKLILCLYYDATAQPPRFRPTLIDFETGKFIRFVDLPADGGRIKWSIDGKSILYALTRNDAGNIWSQPLVGGPPKQLTNFTSQTISRFEPTRDGKSLVVTRLPTSVEIVLIKNFR